MKFYKNKDFGVWAHFLLIVCLFITTYSANLVAQDSKPLARVLVLGDSLTEGYGISQVDAFPKILENKFQTQKKNVEIINAGISGSTTASGLTRLKWHLKKKPDILILALGANDGLRGLPLKQTKENLLKVIQLAKENSIKVLLAGMKIPTNYGKTYLGDFEKIFPDLSKQEGVPLIPFLLEGVAGVKSLNIEDGIHPNEAGHKKIAETVYVYLKEML
jgi:acyl-CoA thioesterase-1